jgi:hypothetical protein
MFLIALRRRNLELGSAPGTCFDDSILASGVPTLRAAKLLPTLGWSKGLATMRTASAHVRLGQFTLWMLPPESIVTLSATELFVD